MPGRVGYLRPAHARDARASYERSEPRQEDKNFYSSARWRATRASVLRRSPLCEDCRRLGRLTPAEHVHHVLPRKDRPDLAYRPENLESLCQPCHNARGVR